MSLYRMKYLQPPTAQDAARGGLLFTRQQYANTKRDIQEKVLVGADEEDIRILQLDPSKTDFSFNHTSNRANRPNRATEVQNSSSLKKDDKVKLGDVVITVKDPYGIRHFKGRENQHSTGIDIVTSTGKAYALNDLTIEDVQVQRVKGFVDGAIMEPTEGQSAGFYIIARNSDGTRSQYMHLNPMTKDEMESLKGKKLKRGDEIWGYNIGSGSMTAPHVKYRVYTGSSGTQSHIDPSDYLRGLIN